jgi:hypothetical protein
MLISVPDVAPRMELSPMAATWVSKSAIDSDKKVHNSNELSRRCYFFCWALTRLAGFVLVLAARDLEWSMPTAPWNVSNS